MVLSWIDDLSVRVKMSGLLLLVGFLLVANVAGVWIFLGQQDHDGAVIDRAGRQRMLVQQMTIQAHYVAMGREDRRDDLVATATEYNRTLQALLTGDESMNVPPPPDPVKHELLETQEEWAPFHRHVRTVAEAPRDSPAFQNSLAYLRDHNKDLLSETDQSVQAFQTAFERKVTRLKWFLGIVAGLDLLALGVLYTLTARRVIRPIDRLATAAEAIARGDHDRPIPQVDTADEIGVLTRSVASMKTQLLSSLRRARGFERAVEHAGASIYLTDADGTIEYVNPAFEDQTGYARDEAVGRNPRILKSGEHGEAFYRNLWETIDAGRVWEGELVNARKDGERYQIEQTIAPVMENGSIERFVAVNHDITDLKRLEDQLRRERDQFAALFENIPEPVVEVELIDGTPVVRRVNPAFVETFGFDQETVVGDSLDEHIIPEGQKPEADELNERCSEGGPIERTVRRQTADGIRTFLLRSATTAVGDNTHCYGIYLDITDRIERQAELERQNERLEEFASVLSHDLRNPLNVAAGGVELVMDEYESEHLDRSLQALRRMHEMIEDLLAMARTGARVENPDPVALEEVVSKGWAMVETRDAGASLETDIGGVTVLADGSRLQQLLENLFHNAVEHGSSDAPVTVTVGTLAGDTGFYVADDGPGIPPEERDRIFDPGYSTTHDGTGFGLKIVREIAEAHGWSIQLIESEMGGARFEFHTGAGPGSPLVQAEDDGDEPTTERVE